MSRVLPAQQCSQIKIFDDDNLVRYEHSNFAERLIHDLSPLGANTYQHIYASSKTNKVTATLITSNLMFMDIDPDIPEVVGDCKYLSVLSIDTNTNDEIQTLWMVSTTSPGPSSPGGHRCSPMHVRR